MMSRFHLNRGLRFERPYESPYAFLRRLLCVNPGLSYWQITSELRALIAGPCGMEERLRALQRRLSEEVEPALPELTEPYRRQCPACMRELYHTYIYALPWLTVCPIHQCEFTTICPECQQPWPTLEQLAKRECSCCGRLSFSQLLKTVWPAVRPERYTPIVELHWWLIQALARTPVRILEFSEAPVHKTHLQREVRLADLEFGSFMLSLPAPEDLRNKEKPRLSTHPVHVISTRLHPVAQDSPMSHVVGSAIRSTSPQRGQSPLERRDELALQIPVDYRVTKTIVSWIASHAGKGHALHVDSYRFLGINYFLHAPAHCPYCLAFSIWLYHLHHTHMYNGKGASSGSYPFLYDGSWHTLLSTYAPKIFVNTDHASLELKERWVNDGNFDLLDMELLPMPADHLRRHWPDQSFAMWLYERTLKVSFFVLLRYAFVLLKQMDSYKKTHGPIIRMYPFFGLYTSMSLYCSVLVDDRLDYYYMDEDLFETYRPKHIAHLAALCHAFQRYHAKHRRDAQIGQMAQIMGDKINKTLYIELCTSISRHLILGSWDERIADEMITLTKHILANDRNGPQIMDSWISVLRVMPPSGGRLIHSTPCRAFFAQGTDGVVRC